MKGRGHAGRLAARDRNKREVSTNKATNAYYLSTSIHLCCMRESYGEWRETRVRSSCLLMAVVKMKPWPMLVGLLVLVCEAGCCRDVDLRRAISYKLAKRNAESTGPVITRRRLTSVAGCMDFAENKRALAFNFGDFSVLFLLLFFFFQSRFWDNFLFFNG